MTSTEDSDKSHTWRLWCRLCAKDDVQGNINVFLKNEEHTTAASSGAAPAGGGGDLALATAISKYFRVKIKPGEELPKMICPECLTLVNSLINFSERISRVQQLFFALLLCKQKEKEVNLNELRLRFDLPVEEELMELGTLTEFQYVEKNPICKLESEEETEVELENPLNIVRQEVEELIVTEEQIPEEEVLNEKIESEEETEMEMGIPLNILRQEVDEPNPEEEMLIEKLEQEEDTELEMGIRINILMEEVEDLIVTDEQVSEEEKLEENPLNEPENILDALIVSQHLLYDEEHEDYKLNPNSLRNRDRSRQCTVCQCVCDNTSALMRHMHQDHNQDFACPECPKKFYSIRSLDGHLNTHLPPSKRVMYSCPKCDKKFCSSYSARKHTQIMHSERWRPFICEQCGLEFSSLATLREHVASHSDNDPFECDLCKKCFKTLRRLRRHKDTCNSNKYICPECGKELNSKATLYTHRLVHTNQKNHKCDYCGKGFKRSHSLKNHLLIHAGVKPFSCNYCDCLFSAKVAAIKHKKSKHKKEMAAEEAAREPDRIVQNLPNLEALKKFTKNKDNLIKVKCRKEGKGRKKKLLVQTDVDADCDVNQIT